MPTNRIHPERDAYIQELLLNGHLESDMIKWVQNRFGGSYTQCAALIRRRAIQVLAPLSLEKRKQLHTAILAGAWNCYRRAKTENSLKQEIAALKLLHDLIGGSQLVNLKDDEQETNPILELVEKTA